MPLLLQPDKRTRFEFQTDRREAVFLFASLLDKGERATARIRGPGAREADRLRRATMRQDFLGTALKGSLRPLL
jgi:hypothetical protein